MFGRKALQYCINRHIAIELINIEKFEKTDSI